MTILVLGGYGTFGSRLCTLLKKDGHIVIVAGRNLKKAQTIANKLDAEAIYLDRNRDLTPALATQASTLVDASGPYQAYGDDPYKVAKFCLSNGINYIDLSDSVEFTQNITQLNELAHSKGCFALSGASSVPAISAAVVSTLTQNINSIESINTAIMPGNKAPRGYSVIASILSQVGLPQKRWQNDVWQHQRCWTEERVYEFQNGQERIAKTIGAPDLQLFPNHFKAKSVTFRAGLELGILNMGVDLVARLNRVRKIPPPEWFMRICHKFAMLTLPFGSDKGGMIVEIIGSTSSGLVKRTWRLWATHGDGPYIPAITTRAILRKIDTIPHGARACLSDVTLTDLKNAFSDLNVSEQISEKPYMSLFHNALGSKFDELPSTVKQLHSHVDTIRYKGIAKVTRGANLLSRVIAVFFGFPKEGSDIPVSVELACQNDKEVWRRNFNGKIFSSVLTATKLHHFNEQFGLFKFEMNLPIEDGTLKMPVTRGWFLGIPIPRYLLPISETMEFERNGKFHFDVGLSAPLCGLLVRYQGSLILDTHSNLA